ncbi:MAG: CvpA family protein [Candidatus Omnitrophota bacterium]
MAVTDILTLLFLVALAFNGAMHGFLASLVKPAAILLSFALAWAWYMNTHQFNTTCVITLSGPILFSWLMHLAIRTWVRKEMFPYISPLSRLGGMAVNLAWGGAMAIVCIGLLSVFPYEKFELQNMGKDVERSQAVAIVRPFLASKGLIPSKKQKMPCLDDICKVDETDKEELSAEKEMQELYNDPHIKKLMSDPEAMAAIQSRNIAKIMQNPIINEMKSDPAFMLKAMRLFPKVQQKINAHETTD